MNVHYGRKDIGGVWLNMPHRDMKSDPLLSVCCLSLSQGIHESGGPSLEYYQLERLVELVVSPYLSNALHSRNHVLLGRSFNVNWEMSVLVEVGTLGVTGGGDLRSHRSPEICGVGPLFPCYYQPVRTAGSRNTRRFPAALFVPLHPEIQRRLTAKKMYCCHGYINMY